MTALSITEFSEQFLQPIFIDANDSFTWNGNDYEFVEANRKERMEVAVNLQAFIEKELKNELLGNKLVNHSEQDIPENLANEIQQWREWRNKIFKNECLQVEMEIFDLPIKMSGRVKAIFKDADDKIILVDWMRGKKSDFNRKVKTIRLNICKYILEQSNHMQVSAMYWWLHDPNTGEEYFEAIEHSVVIHKILERYAQECVKGKLSDDQLRYLVKDVIDEHKKSGGHIDV